MSSIDTQKLIEENDLNFHVFLDIDSLDSTNSLLIDGSDFLFK